MNIGLIIPYFKERNIVSKYVKFCEELGSCFNVFIYLVSGSSEVNELRSGENYEIHRVSAGENCYYTKCVRV